MANFDVSVIYKAIDQFSGPSRKLNSSLKKIRTNLKKATKSATRYNKEIKNLSKSLNKIGKNLRNKVTLPVAAFGAVLLKSAIDGERVQKRFSRVFNTIQKDASSAVGNIRKQFGISSLEAQRALASTGELGKNLRFSEKQALKLAVSVEKIAVTRAAVTEKTPEEVQKIIQSALTGNVKGLEEVGIIIELREALQLIEDAGVDIAALDQFQLAQARSLGILRLIQERTADSTNDFSKSQGLLFLQFNRAKAAISDLFQVLGKEASPILGKVVRGVRKVTEFFSSLSPATRKLALTIAFLAATIGPLLIGLGALTAILGVLISPIGLIVLAITAVGAAIFLLIKNFDKIKEKFPRVARLFKLWGGILKDVFNILSLVAMKVAEFFSTLNVSEDTFLGKILSDLIEIVELIGKAIRLASNFAGFLFGEPENTGGSVAGAINVTRSLDVGQKPLSVTQFGLSSDVKAANAQAAINAGLQVEIIDRNNNVGAVRTKNNGFDRLNVGRNLPGVG